MSELVAPSPDTVHPAVDDAPAEAESPDDDELECRICRCGSEAGVLYHPCRCSGSVMHVHQACLQRWLQMSGKTKCELCNFTFEWTQQYREGTPDQLSAAEFFAEIGFVVLGAVDLLLRALLSLIACAVPASIPSRRVTAAADR